MLAIDLVPKLLRDSVVALSRCRSFRMNSVRFGFLNLMLVICL